MSFEKSKVTTIETLNDAEIYRQNYESLELPQGSFLIQQRDTSDDFGGSFKEIGRLDEAGHFIITNDKYGEVEFNPKQINRSKLAPQTRRFWHIHPHQNEIWTLADGKLLVGLIDLRKGSPTHGLKAKIVLDETRSLYIPSGVAHGLINPSLTNNAILIYITDYHWSGDKDTQEYRIDPREMPFDFVEPELM